jgi:uncharacterized metal-binding protein
VDAGIMEKLAAMNLHKDVLVFLCAVAAASVAQLAHGNAVMLQVEWASEFARFVHALTEPAAIAGIVATAGALVRYEIWKRRLSRKHLQEIEELKRQLREKND